MYFLHMNSDLVYSTAHGRICPGCGSPLSGCTCRKKAAGQVLGNGVVRVSRQTKGRKGKGVSVITGLALNESDLREMAKMLKKRCGSGGTIKNGTIEIQGDWREVLVQELKNRGYHAKLSGA